MDSDRKAGKLRTSGLVTAERVRELLSCDPESGTMRWLKCGNNKFLGKVAGGEDKDGYLKISIDGKRYMLHRIIWLYVHGTWPAQFLDHINGDVSDNRLSNLREATFSQNNRNRRNRSEKNGGLRGINFNRSIGRWRASIRTDAGTQALGYFDTPEQAAEAYRKASIELHGEFSVFAQEQEQ